MQIGYLLALTAFSAVFAANVRALQNPAASCDQYETALRANPRNLEAASRLGQCSVRDYELITAGGDSTRLSFRSSWSTALRALRNAVALDPSYSAAYRPLFFILFAETRDGCSFVTGLCDYVSSVVRDGDSVITIPRPVLLNVPDRDTYEEAFRESQATRRRNLTEARTLAERWAVVAPTDRRPHEYIGRALLRMGDPAAAAIALEHAATLGTTESRRELFWDRLEALVKSYRGTDAARLLDEAAGDGGRDTTRLRAHAVAAINALLGRHRPPPLDSALIRRFRVRIDSVHRTRPPASPPQPSFSERLAAQDTAGARRLLARMDSNMLSQGSVRRFGSVGPEHLISAEYHLTLGDTAGAEKLLAEIEHPFNDNRFQYSITQLYGDPRPWLGRAWSLSGDLAAARRQPEAAVRMYRRVIGLWSAADSDFMPVVDRARASLDALSRR